MLLGARSIMMTPQRLEVENDNMQCPNKQRREEVGRYVEEGRKSGNTSPLHPLLERP
jgi:hypothetical protein